jgi:hypothetical protein
VRGFGIGGSEPGGDHDNTSCCGIHHGGSSKVSPRVRVSSFFYLGSRIVEIFTARVPISINTRGILRLFLILSSFDMVAEPHHPYNS